MGSPFFLCRYFSAPGAAKLARQARSDFGSGQEQLFGAGLPLGHVFEPGSPDGQAEPSVAFAAGYEVEVQMADRVPEGFGVVKVGRAGLAQGAKRAAQVGGKLLPAKGVQFGDGIWARAGTAMAIDQKAIALVVLVGFQDQFGGGQGSDRINIFVGFRACAQRAEGARAGHGRRIL